jgi:hypothetical protein
MPEGNPLTLSLLISAYKKQKNKHKVRFQFVEALFINSRMAQLSAQLTINKDCYFQIVACPPEQSVGGKHHLTNTNARRES